MYTGLDYKIKNPSELKEEFDLAIDCSGNVSAMELAMSLLGHGDRLCVFGVANPKAKLSIEPFQVNLLSNRELLSFNILLLKKL